MNIKIINQVRNSSKIVCSWLDGQCWLIFLDRACLQMWKITWQLLVYWFSLWNRLNMMDAFLSINKGKSCSFVNRSADGKKQKVPFLREYNIHICTLARNANCLTVTEGGYCLFAVLLSLICTQVTWLTFTNNSVHQSVSVTISGHKKINATHVQFL